MPHRSHDIMHIIKTPHCALLAQISSCGMTTCISTTRSAPYPNVMDDTLEPAFASRRFAHGKSKSKSGRGARAAKPFNPLSALGRYEVSLGSGASSSGASSFVEIHELTPGEDGLIGTLCLGRLRGMFILAGSRKGLEAIVQELDEEDDDDDDDDEDSPIGSVDEFDRDANSDETRDEPSSDADLAEDYEPSALELDDEKINRRAKAFEKNSFRNPKFWMRWKGRLVDIADDETGSSPISTPVESDMGYLVFTNNQCEQFDGTITCAALGWEQMKIRGRKLHSRATPCAMAWSNFT